MADLWARGPLPEDQSRRTLLAGPVTVGRVAERCTWAVPWDKAVSGVHAELRWQGGRLHVRRLKSGRNPIFVQGQARDEFSLSAGESFAIGATSFTVVAGTGSSERSPEAEVT